MAMDQVGLTDLEGTLGIGKFRYAIVLCKVDDEDLTDEEILAKMKRYWKFIPLQTLEAEEADMHFAEFCKGAMGGDYKKILVHCDAHQSLIRICKTHGIKPSHPPPGLPQANGVVERQIGVAIAGIRAYLITAGLNSNRGK